MAFIKNASDPVKNGEHAWLKFKAQDGTDWYSCRKCKIEMDRYGKVKKDPTFNHEGVCAGKEPSPLSSRNEEIWKAVVDACGGAKINH